MKKICLILIIFSGCIGEEPLAPPAPETQSVSVPTIKVIVAIPAGWTKVHEENGRGEFSVLYQRADVGGVLMLREFPFYEYEHTSKDAPKNIIEHIAKSQGLKIIDGGAINVSGHGGYFIKTGGMDEARIERTEISIIWACPIKRYGYILQVSFPREDYIHYESSTWNIINSIECEH